MKNRFAQLYNGRVGYHFLIDRLKGKRVDFQRDAYTGVPYMRQKNEED